MSLGDELERLAKMHRNGELTDAEYAAAKARILAGDEAEVSSEAGPPREAVDQASTEAPSDVDASATDEADNAPTGCGCGPRVWMWLLIVLFAVMTYSSFYSFSDESFGTSVTIGSQVIAIECRGARPVGPSSSLGAEACREGLESRQRQQGVYPFIAVASGMGAAWLWGVDRQMRFAADE